MRRENAFSPQGVPETAASDQEARAKLSQALKIVQGKLNKAKEQDACDQLDASWLEELAQWAPVVKDACENLETPLAELFKYLSETQQVLSELRQMIAVEAA